jgi:hypothetical protein
MMTSKGYSSLSLVVFCQQAIALSTDASARSVGSRSAAVSSPNVIIVFADGLGFGDVGFLVATDILTPSIDR